MKITGFIFNYSPRASWSKPPSPQFILLYSFLKFIGCIIYQLGVGMFLIKGFKKKRLRYCFFFSNEIRKKVIFGDQRSNFEKLFAL